jgi:hypothetical protein
MHVRTLRFDGAVVSRGLKAFSIAIELGVGLRGVGVPIAGLQLSDDNEMLG